MHQLAKTDTTVAASLGGPDMRMAILLAARRCFARGGIGHVTMDEIAGEARCGCGDGLPHRSAIGRACFVRLPKNLRRNALIREIADQGIGDPASDLQRIVTSLLICGDNWDLLKLSFIESPDDPTPLCRLAWRARADIPPVDRLF